MNVNALPRARIAGGFLTLGLFVAALYVLRRELHEFTLHDVIHEFRSLPPWRLGLALGLTVLGYGALVGYDLLALHWIKLDLPLRRVAHAAFVGSAFANNIPMAFFVGGSVRYRLYSRAGITAAETAALVIVNILTYSLGLLTLAAVVFAVEPLGVPRLLHLPVTTTRPLALVAAVAVLAYLGWSVLWRRPIHVRRQKLPPPRGLFSLAQIGVSALDWTLSGAALYVLLPTSSQLSLLAFFGVFILGQIAALIAQLPGGLGVFEAIMLAMLAPALRVPAVLGALLAYRVIYFFIPFGIALLLLGVREARAVA
jgi:uncharacterized membrane protein YbhN (UPF0104 family)